LAPAVQPAAAAAPAPAAGALLPSADVNLPQVPFLPVPLPQQMSFPGDITSLLPVALPGVSVPDLAAKPAAAAATAPAAAALPAVPGAGALAPLLMPTAGLP